MGDRDAGERLSQHPGVAMVSFTGSTATGTKVMQSCAPRYATHPCALVSRRAGSLVRYRAGSWFVVVQVASFR
jgi:delta 1-pyrroline-5-carboxylate dehydrogenase